MDLSPIPDLTTVRQLRPFQSTLGEYLGAMAGEGFWASTTGQAFARQRLSDADEGRVLGQEEWRGSPFFRERIPFDERMTVGRARALADVHDDNEYRRFLLQARGAGAAETVLGFGAAMVGGAPAVENFIPIAGPAWRAVQAARFGMRATLAMEAAAGGARAAAVQAAGGGIRGAAAVGALEGLAGNALAMPLVDASRAEFGDDIRFADQLLDLALGAAVGAVFGGASGLLRRWTQGADGEPVPRLAGEDPALSMRDQQIAANALGHAADDVARGRPIDVGADPRLRAMAAELPGTVRQDGEQLAAVPRSFDRAPEDAVEAAPARFTGPIQKELAEAAGLDPATGRASALEAQIAAIDERGRLADADRVRIEAAAEVQDQTVRIREAYEAAFHCVVRG